MRGFPAVLLSPFIVLSSALQAHCDEKEGAAFVGANVFVARMLVELRTAPDSDLSGVAAPPAVPLRIRAVRSGWLMVPGGWLHRSDVVLANDAMKFFSDEILTRPSVFAFASRAAVRLSQGAARLAEDDAKAAINFNPQSPLGYHVRALAREGAGDTDAALRDHNEAIRMGPEESRYYAARAKLEFKLKRFGLAVADLDQALALAPGEAALYHARGRAWRELGDLGRSFTDIHTALGIDASLPGLVNDFWDISMAKGLWDITNAIRRDGNNPDNYELRGTLFLNLGYFHRAMEDFDTAIRLNPRNFSALVSRGHALWESGDYTSATRDLDAALGIEPENVALLCERSLIWAACENARYRNPALALGAASRAVDLTAGDDPVCLSVLAAAYAAAGEFDKAIESETGAIDALGDGDLNFARMAQLRLADYRRDRPYRAKSFIWARTAGFGPEAPAEADLDDATR